MSLISELFDKKVLIEYLYLDLSTCDRCIGTDTVLEDVAETLRPALELAGYEVELIKIEIESKELAYEYRFLSSPTIRVNGADICQSVEENNCKCCSDISGNNVTCRVFKYEGMSYEVPPPKMLAETILQNIFGEPKSAPDDNYQLPENLKNFFEGKTAISSCSCGGKCC